MVATRVLRPINAVAWAAFFNFIAFLVFGVHVAAAISNGVVGGLVGAVIAKAGPGVVIWHGLGTIGSSGSC